MTRSGRPAAIRKILSVLPGPGVPEGDAWMARARELREETEAPVFSEMIGALTHIRLAETEAEQLWPALLAHRRALTERLGRDVGVRVAVFDWFANVDPRFKEPMVVESAELERTERSAMTDWLTGLYNRGAFRASAVRELRRAQRYRQTLSLVLFDIDDFKVVNDRFGHETGDFVLREISRILHRSVRDVDVASRYGGEEFAVLLPETGRAGADAVAERVRGAVARAPSMKGMLGRASTLTISGGIAVYPEDGDELGELLRHADAALYRAKAAGKNRIVSRMDRRLAQRVSLSGLDFRVTVQREADGLTVPATARDISRTGVALLVDEPMEVGQKVQVSIAPASDEPPIDLSGRVVRTAEVRDRPADRSHEIGVGFEESSRARASVALESLFSSERTIDPSERSGFA